MKIITLIGSIATQRALKLISQDAIKIVKYLPKLSIATLFDNSASNINLEMQDVSNDIFTKGLISYDLKNNVLENNNSNMIVLDFLDDIYDFLVNRTTNHTLTASNYLLKYDLDKSLFTDYERIKHFSEEGIEIWKNGCSNFIKEVSHINIVLVKTYIPLYYLDENNHKVMLKGKLKNTIDNINSSLKIYYRYLESQVDCTTIEIQQEFLVEFVSSSGFNLSVASREFEKKVATEFLKQCNIQSALVPSLEERLESFFSIYNSFLELDADIPSIKELYDIGNKYLSKSMYKEAKKCEKLIMLLHNSSVPLSCKLGKGVSFGYGGIGTIVHANAEIGDFVVLGSNITIGGGGNSVMRDGIEQKVPKIGKRVYISTGAKILGGITIGNNCIIGANAVVTKDIPDFSVIAGNPAKIINTINDENYQKYSSYLYKGLPHEEAKKLMFEKF